MHSFFRFLKNKINNLIRKIKKTDSVFYINGPDLLPAPLSKEEESELIDKLRSLTAAIEY